MPDQRERYLALIERRDAGTLTAEEQSELFSLAEQDELLNAERIEAIGKLANLRGVSLRQMMRNLGLRALPRKKEK